ncbi:MAG: GNAT family N-acetyltransferase [Brevundimonas sp.]|uniref:GNAT family N-acetyltransferase n=1 Tax=Brevundimonas sp. TaxID=1871086 RepID=UPI0027214DCD|nr:GNAT family N-acetyltransferase [Brevundimonas sp.]MDO9077452.1 GNAT family N-acetyltransferase [Brevundimonas sp.]MDP3079723.1 GNAT family N-acetyltransferase [Brevundimonas sp.]MDZ4059755.1 GNAT family N-acetyltransferase [Brevundimonas sp.]
MTLLITDRLTLTPMQVSDLPDLNALWADPAFATAIFPVPLTSEDVWFRLLRDIGHWEAVGYGNWAIRETTTGDYVGSVGVLDYHRILDPAFDAPELGWGVAPRFQGQGIAFEAVSAALAWCDDTLNAARTVCMISPDNAPSHALAARAGYTPYVETTYKGSPVVLLERMAR